MSNLTEVVKYLRTEVAREFPLQQLHMFISISQKEGITAEELAEDCDMPLPSVSRGIRTLAYKLNLIMITWENNHNVHTLSDKGRTVTEHLNKLLSDGG